MSRLWKIIIGAVLITTGGIVICFYQFLGLKYYLKAITYIGQLPKENQITARKTLGDTAVNNNYYNGILAHVSSNENGVTGIRFWMVISAQSRAFAPYTGIQL